MNFSQFINNLETMVTIVAIVFAGAWALWQFVLRGYFNVRLIPTVAGEVRDADGVEFLVVRLKIENAGLCRCSLDQEESGLRIWAWNAASDPDLLPPKLTTLVTLPIFSGQDRLESGEIILEEQLVPLPDEKYSAFLLELRMRSGAVVIKTKAVARGPNAKEG